jgi:hypothetical protein
VRKATYQLELAILQVNRTFRHHDLAEPSAGSSIISHTRRTTRKAYHHPHCLELDYPSQCMQSPSPSESNSRSIHLSSVHLLSSCHAEQKSSPIPLSPFHQVIRVLHSIITHQPIQPFCIPTHDPLSYTPPNPLTTLSSTTITPKRKHNTQQQRPQPSTQRYKTVR